MPSLVFNSTNFNFKLNPIPNDYLFMVDTQDSNKIKSLQINSLLNLFGTGTSGQITVWGASNTLTGLTVKSAFNQDFGTILADVTMAGTSSLGVSSFIARVDHRHLSDITKQNLLTSGTNIKTINGISVLGSGDLVISGGGTGTGITDGSKGDITVSGSGANWVINPKAVINIDLADMVSKTYKGRTSAATGIPEDVPIATLKTDLGVGNVDNTSDINKPISTATQAILNLKLNVANPTLTGTLTAPSIASDLVNAKQLATPVTTLTPTGTTQTINLALGSMFILDLSSATGDVTLTIQNLLAGTTYIIFARQGATRRNVIFPTAAAPNATVQNGARSNTYNTGVANIEDLITIASPNGTKIYLSVNNNFA